MERIESCLNPYAALPTPAIYWFCLFVDSVCNPPDLDAAPYWQTDFGRAVRNYQAMVAAEFFRSEFKSKYPGWRVPRRRGDNRWLKDLVVEEAKLWSLTLKALERLQTLGKLPLPPQLPVPITIQTEQIIPLWLQFLTVEYDFLLQIFDAGDTTQPSGKVALAVRQSANQWMLTKGGEDGLDCPLTGRASILFVETCVGLADNSDMFSKNFHTPMIRQRMKVTQLLVKDGCNIINASGGSTKRRRTK